MHKAVGSRPTLKVLQVPSNFATKLNGRKRRDVLASSCIAQHATDTHALAVPAMVTRLVASVIACGLFQSQH